MVRNASKEAPELVKTLIRQYFCGINIDTFFKYLAPNVTIIGHRNRDELMDYEQIVEDVRIMAASGRLAGNELEEESYRLIYEAGTVCIVTGRCKLTEKGSDDCVSRSRKRITVVLQRTGSELRVVQLQLSNVEARSLAMDTKVLAGICRSYEEMYEFNLSTDEFYIIRHTGGSLERIKHSMPLRAYYQANLKVRIHNHDQARIKKALEEELSDTLENDGRLYVEFRRLDNDGEYRWCACEIVCIQWKERHNRRALCLLKDIHGSRKQNENQQQTLIDALMMSERSHMEKIDFWTKLSRDARTDLDGIMGLALIEQRKLQSDSSALEYMHKIYSTAEHLLETLKKAMHSRNFQTTESAVDDEGTFDYEFGSETILLVEDNELSLEIARTVLELKGMRVEIAENGEDAVRMFRDSEPGHYDVILMDVNMPIMDGLTATRLIRSSDRPDASTVAIFAMSANVYSEDVDRAMDTGMDGYFSKPMDVDQLYNVLGRYLAKKKS